MAKNKHQNHAGAFVIKQTGLKKLSRNFAAAITAVVLILGAGLLIYSKHKVPVKQSDTAAAPATDIPGWWLQQYFGSSVCEKDICRPDADPDQDKLTNAQEFYYHTNPLNAFTVKDKLNDGELVAAGFDPSRPGHMMFEEVTAPDNILTDSLFLSSDLQTIAAQSSDISKVVLPLVADDQLKIVGDDQTAIKNYSDQLNTLVNKYFPAQAGDSLVQTLKTGNGPDLDNVLSKSTIVADGIKKIAVPQKLVMFDKYMILMYQLLPQIISSSNNPIDMTSDAWFDKAQAFFAADQKLQIEAKKLSVEGVK